MTKAKKKDTTQRNVIIGLLIIIVIFLFSGLYRLGLNPYQSPSVSNTQIIFNNQEVVVPAGYFQTNYIDINSSFEKVKSISGDIVVENGDIDFYVVNENNYDIVKGDLTSGSSNPFSFYVSQVNIISYPFTIKPDHNGRYFLVLSNTRDLITNKIVRLTASINY
jgi:hypothetical protein